MSEKDFEEYLIMLAKIFHISNNNKKKSNLANDDKLLKLLQYVFKKELKSEAELSESSESESELESDHEAELSELSESDHEKEEQSVKDVDINERNKSDESSKLLTKDEDNYINDK